MARSSARRRSLRSIRVTAAVVLLSTAAAVLLVTVATGSFGAVVAGASLCLASGCGAARLVHDELVESRRQEAADRAAQARTQLATATARAVEQARFLGLVAERLAAADDEIGQLSGALAGAEWRVVSAEARSKRDAGSVARLKARVAELEDDLAGLRGGHVAALGAGEQVHHHAAG